jgi:hypothetical protein
VKPPGVGIGGCHVRQSVPYRDRPVAASSGVVRWSGRDGRTYCPCRTCSWRKWLAGNDAPKTAQLSLISFSYLAYGSGSLVEAGAVSEDGGDGAMGIINGGGGGPPVCAGVCCGNETPGSPCDMVDAGMQCPGATSCPGGLILPTTLTCVAGKWSVASGVCGADGGVADNGCPDSQPANGAPCTLPDGGHCQYGLMCSRVCDAGATPEASVAEGGIATSTGCVSISGRVGPAICSAGMWQTTPLGTCP